jgi:hypothetical protein
LTEQFGKSPGGGRGGLRTRVVVGIFAVVVVVGVVVIVAFDAAVTATAIVTGVGRK